MAKKRTVQENANLIDNVITDKTNITISIKSVKWIVGTLVGLTLSVLGFAYGFKANLDNKIDNLSEQMKNDKIEIMEKIETLKDEEITPNNLKDVVQDGDIKVLFDRTARNNMNTTFDRPDNLSDMPPSILDKNNK